MLYKPQIVQCIKKFNIPNNNFPNNDGDSSLRLKE